MVRQRWAIAVAALFALAVAGCGVRGSDAPSNPPATLPGSPGHFDNGSFTFEYPASWTTLSGRYGEAIVNDVYAVLGTGSWRSGCSQTEYPDGRGSESCTGDTFDISGGRIVLKVWARVGGPVQTCGLDHVANATLGPNAVLESGSGSTTIWEIREPGGHFGGDNNVFVEAHADDAAGRAAAETVVASFRWVPRQPGAGCIQAIVP